MGKRVILLTIPVLFFCSLLQAQSPNTWMQKANLGGGARYGQVTFSIGNFGYMGTGFSGNSPLPDFWQYDPSTDSWTQKANFGGGARYLCVGFSIGNFGYLGTGFNSGTVYNDFWQYDPGSNSWTQKANASGTTRYSGVGFSIGSFGYIGTGISNTTGVTLSDFWQYDPSSDTWVQKANITSGNRFESVGFSIGNFGYVGTGSNGTTYLTDFWQYNPSSDTWVQKANFGGTPRTLATGFSIGNFGYLGTGYFLDATYANDIWQYNSLSDAWIQVANLSNFGRIIAKGFSVGNYGYLGGGLNTNNVVLNDLWQYTPDCQNPITNNTITAPSPATFCGSGTPAAINGSIPSGGDGIATYQWQQSPDGNTFSNINGATGKNYSPGNLTQTTYFRRVVNSFVCTDNSSATVITINPAPTPPTITAGGSTTFCPGNSVTLTSSATSGNQWSDNGTPLTGQTAQTFIATTSGSYTVTTTGIGGCNATSGAISVTAGDNTNTPVLWGMTSSGGGDNLGSVFETNGAACFYTNVHSFGYTTDQPMAGFPQLITGPASKLYGVTSALYTLDPASNSYTRLYDLNGNGYNYPVGALLYANDGKLYGTTNNNGSPGTGILYSFDVTSNTFTKLYDFYTSNTADPMGGVIQATNGLMYGLASNGNGGYIYSFDPFSKKITDVYDFLNATDGKNPTESLINGIDGKLYGMTSVGGVNFTGVIFSFDPNTNTYLKLFDFDINNGTAQGPYGHLVQASSGMFYGVTYAGINNSAPTLFSYDKVNNAVNVISYNFGSPGSPYNPGGSPFLYNNNMLYGTTFNGGSNNEGIAYAYDINASQFTKILDFTGPNGSFPTGSFGLAQNGKLYAVTSSGGASVGVIYAIDPANSNAYTKITDMFVPIGSNPGGALNTAANGKLYGLTSAGGLNGRGVIFSYDPLAQSFSKLYDFSGADGSGPLGNSMMQASNGLLYGMTQSGGVSNAGVLFSYDPLANVYVKLHDFSSSTGTFPSGSLIQITNGKLYGLTQAGGTSNLGTIFSFDPVANIYTVLFNFASSAATGSGPQGSLIKSSLNGKLYGMAQGGTNAKGVIFSFDPSSNSYLKLFDFNGSNGFQPRGTFVQSATGKLYAATIQGGGGAQLSGVAFSFDPSTNNFSVLIDFATQTNASNPQSTLLMGSDGNLYGLTKGGGANGQGIMYSYNLTNNAYTKLFDFTTTTGFVESSFDGHLVQFGSSSPLPLTWLDFTATTVGKNVVLNWQTALEENTKSFIVEHSMDGDSSFSFLATMPANGNSSGISSYRYIHEAPLPGLHFYRLKEIDMDGRITYSPVASAKIGTDGIGFTVSPNPTSDVLVIKYTTRSGATGIRISTIDGRILRYVTVHPGDMQTTLSMTGLAKAVYIVELINSGFPPKMVVVK